jgi:predicted nuclease with TOPRIM domain
MPMTWPLPSGGVSGNVSVVSTLQQIEKAIEVLPRKQVEELREWIENLLEDQQELTDEFAAKIEKSESEMAEGKGRIHRDPARS